MLNDADILAQSEIHPNYIAHDTGRNYCVETFKPFLLYDLVGLTGFETDDDLNEALNVAKALAIKTGTHQIIDNDGANHILVHPTADQLRFQPYLAIGNRRTYATLDDATVQELLFTIHDFGPGAIYSITSLRLLIAEAIALAIVAERPQFLNFRCRTCNMAVYPDGSLILVPDAQPYILALDIFMWKI